MIDISGLTEDEKVQVMQILADQIIFWQGKYNKVIERKGEFLVRILDTESTIKKVQA
jgi:hypothetical protein